METYNYSNEEIQEVAITILNQIRATTANNIYYSWGVLKPVATLFNGSPALGLMVRARLLHGFVFVVYNAGLDLYELYTHECEQKGHKKLPKLIASEVYAEDLGDLIDRTIERGDDWNEYCAFVKEE